MIAKIALATAGLATLALITGAHANGSKAIGQHTYIDCIFLQHNDENVGKFEDYSGVALTLGGRGVATSGKDDPKLAEEDRVKRFVLTFSSTAKKQSKSSVVDWSSKGTGGRIDGKKVTVKLPMAALPIYTTMVRQAQANDALMLVCAANPIDDNKTRVFGCTVATGYTSPNQQCHH